MRSITTLFIVSLIPAILFVDFLVSYLFGYESTITGVTRDWAKESSWPELVYVLIFTALYYHLFRGWPDGR